MHTYTQIVCLPTYMSSSLLPFRPFFVFPITNIYIYKQCWSYYNKISTVSEQNKSLKIPRTLHMALIIRHIRFRFLIWSWHGSHSRHHEKCSWYATVVTVFHGAYSIRLPIRERLSKFNINNTTQKTWHFNLHVIFSRRLAQGLGVPSAGLVNTRISFVLVFSFKSFLVSKVIPEGSPGLGPSTRRSRATCFSRNSVMLPAKTFKTRQNVSTSSLVKPR